MARFLIEAHHPAHIHFWKYPIRELQARGHSVLMVARDRDVMRRLLEFYDWIDFRIPRRISTRNKFPLGEMLRRQMAILSAIKESRPDVVASLMGSYCQASWFLGVPNIVFTDTETQTFNHRISHPFAAEVHTPFCFLKDLGPKQRRYLGIHELAFLGPKYFCASPEVVSGYGLEAGRFVMIRLSAWNTFHDRKREGVGEHVLDFIERFKGDYEIVVSAEEGKYMPQLENYVRKFAPEDFHHLLGSSRFLLSEGASTASEAVCLGVPTVFINSTGDLGTLKLLERETGLMQSFQDGATGITEAIRWLERLPVCCAEERVQTRLRLNERMVDVVAYVVNTLESCR